MLKLEYYEKIKNARTFLKLIQNCPIYLERRR